MKSSFLPLELAVVLPLASLFDRIRIRLSLE